MLDKIKTYFTDNIELNKNLDMILAGHFKFPPRFLNWVFTIQCIFADYVEGESDETEQSFQLLLHINSEFSLDEIVHKQTREINILDLVFTDNPTIFQSGNITDITPIRTMTSLNLVSAKSHKINALPMLVL